MAKWAADKKKAKEESEKKQQEELQNCKYGVFKKGFGWFVKVIQRGIEGCWCEFTPLQKDAKQFDTQDQADEVACAISLGTNEYINGTTKALPLIPSSPGYT